MPTRGPARRATTVRVSIGHGRNSTTTVTAVAATQPATYHACRSRARLAAPLRVSSETSPAATTNQLKVPPDDVVVGVEQLQHGRPERIREHHTDGGGPDDDEHGDAQGPHAAGDHLRHGHGLVGTQRDQQRGARQRDREDQRCGRGELHLGRGGSQQDREADQQHGRGGGGGAGAQDASDERARADVRPRRQGPSEARGDQHECQPGSGGHGARCRKPVDRGATRGNQGHEQHARGGLGGHQSGVAIPLRPAGEGAGEPAVHREQRHPDQEHGQQDGPAVAEQVGCPPQTTEAEQHDGGGTDSRRDRDHPGPWRLGRWRAPGREHGPCGLRHDADEGAEHPEQSPPEHQEVGVLGAVEEPRGEHQHQVSGDAADHRRAEHDDRPTGASRGCDCLRRGVVGRHDG